MHEYHNEDIHNKIQHWAMTHQPGDDMLYKEAWWRHIVYVREEILPMLYMESSFKNSNDSYTDIVKRMSSNYDIIGEHTSKSLKFPVYEFRYKGAVITARYNVYNWEIHVESPVELDLIPKGLFKPDEDNFYFEGFPKDRCISTPYSKDKKSFTARIDENECKMYTFMFILKNQLDVKN